VHVRVEFDGPLTGGRAVRKPCDDLLAFLIVDEILAGRASAEISQASLRDVQVLRGLDPDEAAVVVPLEDIEGA
jgi:hypothetical protein